MSVYHSIRGSMQPRGVEAVEDPDGLVVVDLTSEPDTADLHPAERGQVSITNGANTPRIRSE